MRNSIRIALVAWVAVACFALPALAQNGAPADDTGNMQPAPAMEDGAARDDAMRRVPTYEEPADAGAEESPQDAFMTLAQDFIFLSEIGGRSQGRVPIWPRGQLKLGPVLFFPYLEGRIAWTSNAFDSVSEQRSWYATEGGGFAGRWDFLAGRGAFTFGADYRHMDYFGDVDKSYSEWTGGAGFEYSFRNGAWVKAGVKWEHLVDPVDAQFAGELKRDQVYPYVTLGFDNAFGNKINVEFGLDYTYANFKDQAYETADRTEWDAHATASYPFLRNQTRLYLRYDYFFSQRDSNRINDLNQGHELSGGLMGEIPLTRTERLTGTLGIGYRRDLYGSPRNLRIGSATVQTDDDRRKGTLTVHAAVQYEAGAKTTVDLSALRTLQFSTFGNYQIVNRADLGIQHNCLRNLVSKATLFGEYTDPSSGAGSQGNSFTRYGFGLGSRYLLTDNADIDLDLDWYRRITDQVGFDTTVLQASLGVTLYLR